MRKIITLLFIVLTTMLFGQSTITVFNNGGQQFYVILNGVKQNSIAQTNVSVSGIKNGSYSMKLIFADGKTSDIDKNFFLEEPSFVTTRVVFKKGKGKLQLIGMEPAANQAPAENIVVYRPTDNVDFSDAPVVTQTTIQQSGNVSAPNSTNGNVGINVNTNVKDPNMNNGQGSMNTSVNVNGSGTQQTTQQTTTTTTNVNNGNPNQTTENVGININMNVTDPTMNNGQGGVNMSINMTGTGTGTQTTQQSTTVTTTTTTSTTGTGSNATINSNANSQNGSNNTVTNTQNNTNTVSSNQSIKCVNILSDEKKLIAELKDMTFDEDKKEIVIKDLEKHCLTASQAYKIIEVFTFEADRLELSKYLYLRMIDKDKGSSLLPLFTFDASKMEFREFMRSVK